MLNLKINIFKYKNIMLYKIVILKPYILSKIINIISEKYKCKSKNKITYLNI